MQQRTGFQPGKRRLPGRQGVPVVYYAFDLLYLDGFDLRRVPLEQRKALLRDRIKNDADRVSPDSFFRSLCRERARSFRGSAKQRGLEGILAKKRNSQYEEKRSRRLAENQNHTASGVRHRRLHRSRGQPRIFRCARARSLRQEETLIHVGQAGTGFDHKTLKEMFARSKP